VNTSPGRTRREAFTTDDEFSSACAATGSSASRP
jgi:hypothetical protein